MSDIEIETLEKFFESLQRVMAASNEAELDRVKSAVDKDLKVLAQRIQNYPTGQNTPNTVGEASSTVLVK